VIDYIAGYERRLEAPEYFDEAHVRALVARIVDRTNDVAASVMNHALAEEGELACGRLVYRRDHAGNGPRSSGFRPAGASAPPATGSPRPGR
jgi:hypothetical protein